MESANKLLTPLEFNLNKKKKKKEREREREREREIPNLSHSTTTAHRKLGKKEENKTSILTRYKNRPF